MRRTRFDALVIGSGPAGSVAALVLARGGARVALVDKASFPRDKACGDMVGPRGVQLLADLGLPVPAGPRVGDMLVVGPTGRRVQMPSAAGLTYPGYGTAVTRTAFDAMLHDAATEAGVTALCGRAAAPLEASGRVDGYRLESGEDVRADFVIGADGATSGVAQAAGLVEASRGPVGLRPPHLPAAGRRPRRHCDVGADAVARLPRLRLGVPRRRRRRQHRARDRHQGRPSGGSESRAVVAGVSRPPPRGRPAGRGRPGRAATPPRGMAEDGHGGDHPGRRTGAAGRRRGRAHQSVAGRRDRPGHAERSVGRGDPPGRARTGGRALLGRPVVRAHPVPTDHRGPAGRAGGPARGGGRRWSGFSPPPQPSTRSPEGGRSSGTNCSRAPRPGATGGSPARSPATATP